MIEVEVSIEVDRPPDEVFAYWADWTNNPRWQSGMERCTWTSEPPLRVGSTYDQEATFLGRTIRSAIPLDITREVVPRPDGGTTLRATIRGEPTGLLRLLGPLTQRMVERNVRADYARLQALLDG